MECNLVRIRETSDGEAVVSVDMASGYSDVIEVPNVDSGLAFGRAELAREHVLNGRYARYL